MLAALPNKSCNQLQKPLYNGDGCAILRIHHNGVIK